MPDSQSEKQKDKLKSVSWASKLLAGEYGDWVILDTETTGLYGAEPIEICVLSRYGNTLLNTRIKPTIPIEKGAIDIHGITEEALIDAPRFIDIYPQLKKVIENKLVVIYNASFDESVIWHSILRNKLPRIKYKTECAMMQYARYFGEWSNYFGNYKWQKLPGGEHTAKSDCLATYNLIKEMAANNKEPYMKVIHHKLFPPFQIGIKWERFIEIRIGRKNYESKHEDYNRIGKPFYLRIPKLYRLTDKDVEEVIYRDEYR